MTANIAIAQLMLSALLVSVTFIWGIFRYRRADYHRRDRYKKLQAYLLWGLSGLITISTFYPLSFLYTEHLWSENLGVHRRVLGTPQNPLGVLRALLHRCGRVYEHQRRDCEYTVSRIA